jgi:hypothetical protein
MPHRYACGNIAPTAAIIRPAVSEAIRHPANYPAKTVARHPSIDIPKPGYTTHEKMAINT